MYFFGKRPDANLRVDGGPQVGLSAHDQSHLGGDLTDEFLGALRAGSRAELMFGGQRVYFSLLGFTKAYEARTGTSAPQATDDPELRSVVAAHLPGNKFKLTANELQVEPNPRGEGAFVFFPEMEIAGYQRLFVWFVHGDQAVALNGPSKTATPTLPYPREVSYRFWTDTGLSVGDVTQVGLQVAFE